MAGMNASDSLGGGSTISVSPCMNQVMLQSGLAGKRFSRCAGAVNGVSMVLRVIYVRTQDRNEGRGAIERVAGTLGVVAMAVVMIRS